MSGQYKLTYFNWMGRAESIRFLFAYKNIPYEDIRFEFVKDWEKNNNIQTPWGQLPILELPDGQILSQMNTILRYLAKNYELAGDSDLEAAKCDEHIEAVHEFAIELWETCFEKDEGKKRVSMEKLLDQTIPKYMSKWNDILEKNGGFLVGNRFSYPDFSLAPLVDFFQKILGAERFSKYGAVLDHVQSVYNAPGIKEWILRRPVTNW